MIARATVFALASLLVAIPASPAPAPFTINAILPITGAQAFQGAAMAQTLNVFFAYANKHGGLRGQPIALDIHDDQSNPATTVQLTTQIAAAHPAVILGSTTGGTCSAQIPLVKDGPVTWCFSPAIHPAAGSYSFAGGIAVDPFVNGMIRYLRLRGFKRIGIISSTDGSGTADDDSSRRSLALAENKDVDVVAWEHFNPADIGVPAQAAKMKTANVQAVIVWTNGTAFGTVLRSLSDAGVSVPVETTNGNANVAQLKQYVTFWPKELVMSGSEYILPPNLLESPAMRRPLADLLEAWKDAGLEPSAAATPTVWDPAAITLSGLRKIGPAATATQLRDYILGLRTFAGVNGMYDFSSGDQHGLLDRSVVIVGVTPKGDQMVFAPVSRPGGVPR